MDPTSSPDWRSPEAIQKWWSTPSQREIKRDYPPSTVVALRDGLFEAHNRPAIKLRDIFARHQQCKSVHLVPSVIEPVSLQMISEVGFGGSGRFRIWVWVWVWLWVQSQIKSS